MRGGGHLQLAETLGGQTKVMPHMAKDECKAEKSAKRDGRECQQNLCCADCTERK